ncbi:MAG TPA: STAS domain-containing protein [Solirubrobacteraceae bacterium]|jgi:anti-anti-sigma factor
MERQLTASAMDSKTRSTGGPGRAVANRTRTAPNGNGRSRSPVREPRLVLASASVWTHTLVLTGGLDHRSAHALEAEIERLCEEGVTGIALDLRELSYIDSIGVAVIVFRCGHCRRRGFDFTLVPGSPEVQSAFERAGVSDALPFRRPELVASQAAARAPIESAPLLAAADAHEVVSAQSGQAT